MRAIAFKATTAVAIAALFVACGDSRAHVTSAEYGSSWPFTVLEGKLRCETDGPRKYVTLDTGRGIFYALNGSAKTFGYPDVASIQKPGTTGADLQPFIARGLALCS